MHPRKDKITVVIIFLGSCCAPISALDYNERCAMVPDLCDANKFLQCGPQGYCECHNAPEAFYDTVDRICKLKSGARCHRLGTKYQPCVNDAYCPEAPDAVCTCVGDFVSNRDRNCFIPHSSRCSIVDQKCDPSGFLQCGPNSICECQQRGESWYNDNTKTCHLLTGASCLLPPDQMQCVPNAECDLNTRKCRCSPGLDETDRMCYLGYQMDCQPFQDMCNFNGFMQCNSSSTTGSPVSTTINPDIFSCLNKLDGMYPHPTDCAQFIACRGGLADYFSCPPPLLFHPSLKVCVYEEEVECETSCDGREDGTYAHPYDCSLYILCRNEIGEIFKCPPPLLFHKGMKSCHFPDLVQC